MSLRFLSVAGLAADLLAAGCGARTGLDVDDAPTDGGHAEQSAVLFGGQNDAMGGLADTWAWDGQTWTRQQRQLPF